MKNREELEGFDVCKFRTDNEYDYHPYFGTFKKGISKRNRPEPEREPVEMVTFSITESYHDENGKLRQRTIKYTVNEDGTRNILPNDR